MSTKRRLAEQQPHEIVVCGVPFETEHEKEALQRLKEIGVTSVQIYTFWNRFEPETRGSFDWSFYDREVELIQEAGLKYVPFILMGPKYAAPQWWLDSDGHAGLYCLEHGTYNPIESIWNPRFREEIIRVLEAFAAHYGSMGVLESVQPGICGDYGESIMPVVGNWPGDYHTHAGYWCAGEDARASLQSWLAERFGDIGALNAAWRTHHASFGEVAPFLEHKAPSRTAWFDLLDWYRWSMTEYTEFWMAECRRIFADLPVYMCTGGVESPQHASNFAAQARVCAEHQGGIRLTNEGNRFYDNFFITAYCHSACEYYGAYMGLEPVGPMIDTGVVARIFGSAAYGNRQMFHYYGNLFAENVELRPAAHSLKRYADMIQERPLPDTVGVFWPGYYTAWHDGTPDDLKDCISFIRSLTNCRPINDDMILDGALDRVKLLVAPVAGFTRRAVLQRIAAWVRAGGTLLSTMLTTDLELDAAPEYAELFGILPTSEHAAGISRHHTVAPPEFASLREIPLYTCNTGWMHLAPDVVPLAETEEGPAYAGTYARRVTSAFMRRAGKGMAIYYEGPMNFHPDPEALFVDPGVYKALLVDVLRHYAHTADLTPEEDEIARAEIDGRIVALKKAEIVVTNEAPRHFGNE